MFTRKLSFTPIKYPKARAMGITEFPYKEYDSNGNEIYWEGSTGVWYKSEYNSNNREIYYEDSDGVWAEWEFDSNDKETYYKCSNGEWRKCEYDSNGNIISYTYS